MLCVSGRGGASSAGMPSSWGLCEMQRYEAPNLCGLTPHISYLIPHTSYLVPPTSYFVRRRLLEEFVLGMHGAETAFLIEPGGEVVAVSGDDEVGGLGAGQAPGDERGEQGAGDAPAAIRGVGVHQLEAA